MSRTFRRTKEKHHNKSGSSHFAPTHDYVEQWEGRCGIVKGWAGHPKVALPKNHKSIAQFHSDNRSGILYGNHKGGRHESHVTLRMKYKKQLNRYFQNTDYEIVELKLRCLSWDRC
jgi:hypothetical protein